MNNTNGYRGYIGTRSYFNGKFPQRVQNMIIRNYCREREWDFLLSGTEYAMPGCYMILEEIVNTISEIEGIVLFSIFLLPEAASKRKKIYQKIIDHGRSLHAALEDYSVRTWEDVQVVENILKVKNIIMDTITIHQRFSSVCRDELNEAFCC